MINMVFKLQKDFGLPEAIAQFHIEQLKSSNMDLIQQGEKVFKI